MKKFTISLSLLFLFAAAKISAQTCNNVLTATISGVVNSSSCTPCNGQATVSCPNATSYLWQPGNQSTPTATGLCAGTYTVYCVNTSNFDCGSAVTTITCPNAIIENNVSTYVDLFPNPASESLSITFSYPNGGDVKEISVFNSIGEKVLGENFSSKKFTNKLFVGNLPSGVYFMELKDEKNLYRTKFMKE